LSAGAFIAGIIALICACLVVLQHVHGVLGIRRLHEFIARSTAGFIAIGMLTASCWEIIANNLKKRGWSWGCVCGTRIGDPGRIGEIRGFMVCPCPKKSYLDTVGGGR